MMKTENLITNPQGRIMPTAAGLSILCGNHINNSWAERDSGTRGCTCGDHLSHRRRGRGQFLLDSLVTGGLVESHNCEVVL